MAASINGHPPCIRGPILQTDAAPRPVLHRSFSSRSVPPQCELPPTESSVSPTGVDAALRAASDSSFVPKPTLLQKEFSLEGRVAVVTGGGRGLGLEMAEALAEAGATVYCIAKSLSPDDTWKATQSYVSKLGLSQSVRLEYVSVDVSDQKAIWTTMEEIAKKEGRLDICVASAGIVEVAPCLEATDEHFKRVIGVNETGTFYTAQAAGRQMMKLRRPGSIILITSSAGSFALQGMQVLAYSATKAASIQMARTLAMELSQYGVRVNSLSPGYMLSGVTQSHMNADAKVGELWASQNILGRIGRPAELRGVVIWLASDASSFCTGSNIVVDGGHHAW
ncbi:hypothetical protein ACEPAF_7127 [Sanghuangporus sanghuang]